MAGITNAVVYASSPEGPWSDPVDLKIGHIDPGHVADDQGNRYLHMSDGYFVPLARDGLSVTGEMKKVYDGWPFPEDYNVECFCLEAPKITKRNGYYYLTSAEGGTAGPATSHMVVSSRSRTPWGPWEHSPHNPIVHTSNACET
jgi:xylan 1,4-beta-xylosidase